MIEIAKAVLEASSSEVGKATLDVPEFARAINNEKVVNFEQADRPIYKQIQEVQSEPQDVHEKTQIDINREQGDQREAAVLEELNHQYPVEEGYEVTAEQYLRDSDGRIVKDLETGEARRVDFVVLKDGEVVQSIEVTSETAPKDAQLAKEERIREQGGEWIRHPETHELYRYNDEVKTEVWRRA
ncbi:hypothetical protein ACMX2M_07510 [Paenibacillus polymyxa]